MVTISLCMIVKDEEKNLATCLDCLKDVCEEIIIVDTGSRDRTKEIALGYTEKVYDFTWIGDFSAARNFAFEKATMDYIYSADADEFLDEENREKLHILKENLLPEIEIVQMIYREEGISTVLNDREELRPKLYKRLRKFNWIDPVHETIRTLPVVFDSDIIIDHRPEGLHAPRDFSLIEKAYERDGRLSDNLYTMYATEVYKWGDKEALKRAYDIFEKVLQEQTLSLEILSRIFVVMAKSARLNGNIAGFIKYVSRVLAVAPCSEICCELGDYFLSLGDKNEAHMWYYNAIDENNSILDIASSTEYPEATIRENGLDKL